MGVNVFECPTGVHGRAEREEHGAMREIEIHDYARQLLEEDAVPDAIFT